MKNCLRLFLLLCIMLAISTLSAAEKHRLPPTYMAYSANFEPVVPFIDLLENGDSYHIEIVSLGCFSGSKQTLTIFKEANGYSLSFDDAIKKLSEFEIDVIRDFELKLQALSVGGCSTVDIYTLTYGTDSIRISDGTCSFNGGSKLMQQLGLVPSN